MAGTINGFWIFTAVRDTGCSCVLVSEEGLPDADVSNARKVLVVDFLGKKSCFPLLSAIFSVFIMTGGVSQLELHLSLLLIFKVTSSVPVLLSIPALHQLKSLSTKAFSLITDPFSHVTLTPVGRVSALPSEKHHYILTPVTSDEWKDSIDLSKPLYGSCVLISLKSCTAT